MRPVRVPRTFSIAVRIVVALAVAGVVLFIADRAVVPSGLLTVTTDFRSSAPFLSGLKPSERVQDRTDGGVSRAIIGHPVYLDVTPPSPFDTVSLSLRYKDPGAQELEIGGLASSLEQQYTLEPAEQPLLDSISWPSLKSGTLTLFQRTPTYASVDAFLKDPPPPAEVAVYRAPASIGRHIPGYEPSSRPRSFTVSLRGHHRMWTYVKDETLQFTFQVQDMNRQAGADPVILSVYAQDDLKDPVARTVLQDDGDTKDDQRSTGLRTLSVSVRDLPEGAYQIEFTASNDVFIRDVTTTQRKLVFEDSLYLGDHVGYSDTTRPLTVYTDGSRIVARTAHPEALQTLAILDGRRSLEHLVLNAVNTPFSAAYPVASGLREITSPKLDILLETDGFFSLTPDEFFNPLPFRVQWYTTADDLRALGIDYILTSYEPPVRDGEFHVAQATFDTADLARTPDGAYRFVIDAPGIEEQGLEIDLASLTVSFRRPGVPFADILPRFIGMFSQKAAPEGPTVVTTGSTYGETLP